MKTTISASRSSISFLMLLTLLSIGHQKVGAQASDGEYMENDRAIFIRDGKVIRCEGHFDEGRFRQNCNGLRFNLESYDVISATMEDGTKLLFCKAPPPPQGTRLSIPECGEKGWFFR